MRVTPRLASIKLGQFPRWFFRLGCGSTPRRIRAREGVGKAAETVDAILTISATEMAGQRR